MSARRRVPVAGSAPAESGAVALEVAMATPLVALLVAAVLGTTGVVTDQLVVERAARVVARSVALGEVAPSSSALGLPADAVVRVTRVGRSVAVEVRLDAALVGVPVRLTGRAAAPLEPGVP